MNQKQLKERISEFARIHTFAGNGEAELLETALFIEDAFSLVLSDDEICGKNLGTRHAIEKFVLEKLNLRKSCVASAE